VASVEWASEPKQLKRQASGGDVAAEQKRLKRQGSSQP
jgi:hypothetical protein